MKHLGQLKMIYTYETLIGHMRQVTFVAELDALEAEAQETNAALRAVLKKLGG